MCVRREDYECFGLSTSQSQILTYAMADTGCQSCLAGLKVIQRLWLTAKDLIPVHLKMHGADNHAINILGTTILRLSGKYNTGGDVTTRKMVYITNNMDKLFLSREPCTDLGIISPQFPKMNVEVNGANPVQSINAATANTGSHSTQGCDCPKRMKSLPPLLHYHTQPQRTTERSSNNSYSIIIEPAHSMCASIRAYH